MNMLFDALVAPLETRTDAVLITPDQSEISGKSLFALSGSAGSLFSMFETWCAVSAVKYSLYAS